MPLNPELFERLLFLARITVSDAEREMMLNDFDRTLAMIDDMHEAPTESLAPLEHPLSATLRLRDDELTEEVKKEDFQQLAPSTDQGLYLVPKVID